jgi:hypothetical protein
VLALSLVLITAGIVLLFFISYAGIVVGAIGVLLFIAFLFGVGRAARDQPHQF